MNPKNPQQMEQTGTYISREIIPSLKNNYDAAIKQGFPEQRAYDLIHGIMIEWMREPSNHMGSCVKANQILAKGLNDYLNFVKVFLEDEKGGIVLDNMNDKDSEQYRVAQGVIGISANALARAQNTQGE